MTGVASCEKRKVWTTRLRKGESTTLFPRLDKAQVDFAPRQADCDKLRPNNGIFVNGNVLKLKATPELK